MCNLLILKPFLVKRTNVHYVKMTSFLFAGSILDRNGQLLSVSVPMSAIVAEPRLMLKENALDDKERIKALANELNMTPAELVKKLRKMQNQASCI